MASLRLFIKNVRWFLLAVLTFVLGIIFQAYPHFTEVIYFKGIFQLFRVIYDYTLGWIPVPMVYFLFILVVYIIYKYLGVGWQYIKDKKYGSLVFLTLNGLSVVFILFYVLWGFNYYTPSVKEKLSFSASKMDVDDLYYEALNMAQLVSETREVAIGDSNVVLVEDIIPDNMEYLLRRSQKQILSEWGYPTVGRVRIRKLKPNGVLLRISTAGVYIPWVFEGHIDGGLHPIHWPFTMAHEMAHGYGITDEGECNFVGFVTCINSEDPIIRYSGHLAYFRYLINNLRLADNERYNEVVKTLSKGVKNDINAIVLQMRKYPDILPDLRDLIYDSYLKSHGVTEGLASYSSIIRLINQWKEANNNQELIRRTFPWSGRG